MNQQPSFPPTSAPGYPPPRPPSVWTRARVGAASGAVGVAIGLALGIVLGLAVGIATSDDEREKAVTTTPVVAVPELSQEDLDEAAEEAARAAETETVQRMSAQRKADLRAQRATAKDRLARAMERAEASQRRAVAAAVRKVRAAERARSAKLVAAAQASAQPAAPVPLASGGGTDPMFDYCYEAVDAGYGPYYQGQDPEYNWYDDADGDGAVCE